MEHLGKRHFSAAFLDPSVAVGHCMGRLGRACCLCPVSTVGCCCCYTFRLAGWGHDQGCDVVRCLERWKLEQRRVGQSLSRLV